MSEAEPRFTAHKARYVRGGKAKRELDNEVEDQLIKSVHILCEEAKQPNAAEFILQQYGWMRNRVAPSDLSDAEKHKLGELLNKHLGHTPTKLAKQAEKVAGKYWALRAGSSLNKETVIVGDLRILFHKGAITFITGRYDETGSLRRVEGFLLPTNDHGYLLLGKDRSQKLVWSGSLAHTEGGMLVGGVTAVSENESPIFSRVVFQKREEQEELVPGEVVPATYPVSEFQEMFSGWDDAVRNGHQSTYIGPRLSQASKILAFLHFSSDTPLVRPLEEWKHISEVILPR